MDIQKNIKRIKLYKKFLRKLVPYTFSLLVISIILFLINILIFNIGFILYLFLIITLILGITYIIIFINILYLKNNSFNFLIKHMPKKYQKKFNHLKKEIPSLEKKKAKLRQEANNQFSRLNKLRIEDNQLRHNLKVLAKEIKVKKISANKQTINFGDKIFMCELRKVIVRGGKFTEKVFCKEIKQGNKVRTV